MFVVLLRFARNRDRAGALVERHMAWIDRGVDDGVFLLVGSLDAGLGGAIVAHGLSRPDLEARVRDDPFVAEGVVEAEILGITPTRTDDRLSFLGG